MHHHTVLCGAEDGPQGCGVLGEHLLTDHPLAPEGEISVQEKGFRLEATGFGSLRGCWNIKWEPEHLCKLLLAFLEKWAPKRV